MKIVDCVLYNGELKLLRQRIQLLRPFVSLFVVVEGTHTFQGGFKRLQFPKVRLLFDAPIKYIVADLDPNPISPWDNELTQRNAADRFLSQCDCDYIMHMDVDEIVNPGIFAHMSTWKPCQYLSMTKHYYSWNWVFTGVNWDWGFLVSKEYFVQCTDSSEIRRRDRTSYPHVPSAGWHCSYFMTAEEIVKKLKSFSHSEYNTKHWTDLARIKTCIREGRDLFDRSDMKLDRFYGDRPSEE